MLKKQVFSLLAAFALFAALATAVDPLPATADAQPTVTPTLPPADAFSAAELAAYRTRGQAELCNNPDRTVRDYEYVKFVNPDVCAGAHNASGMFAAGIYGYNHPNATYCNATNGLRSSVPAIVTGVSAGSKNLITYVLALFGLISAGCNNAPASQASSSPMPVTTASLIFAPDALSLPLNGNYGIGVSEANYAGQYLAATDNASVVSIVNPVQTPGSIGGAVTFALKVIAPGSAKVRIYDGNGNAKIVDIQVTPTPSPSPASSPAPAASTSKQ